MKTITLFSAGFMFFAPIVFMFGILVRNIWVHKNRMRVTNESHDKYRTLPSREVMMRKFWIWNINKFLSNK